MRLPMFDVVDKTSIKSTIAGIDTWLCFFVLFVLRSSGGVRVDPSWDNDRKRYKREDFYLLLGTAAVREITWVTDFPAKFNCLVNAVDICSDVRFVSNLLLVLSNNLANISDIFIISFFHLPIYVGCVYIRLCIKIWSQLCITSLVRHGWRAEFWRGYLVRVKYHKNSFLFCDWIQSNCVTLNSVCMYTIYA